MSWNGHFYFYQQLFIFQSDLVLLELIFTISNGIPLTTSAPSLLSALLDPYPDDLLYNTCQSHLLHSHPQTNFSSQDSRKALQKEKDWKGPKHVVFTLFVRSMS